MAKIRQEPGASGSIVVMALGYRPEGGGFQPDEVNEFLGPS
jgi:hypothetical protein